MSPARPAAGPAEPRGGASEPAPRSWRDPVQAAIALKARRGKFRRRTKSCLCCGLIFVIAVIALVMLATLAAQDAGHAAHDAATPASNATNGTLVARVRKTVRSKVEKIVVTSSCTIGLLLLAGHLIRGRSKMAARTALVFGFFTELNGPFATIMPSGFAGGPVIAEAMKDLYAEDSFNYPDGYSLALFAATIGMFVGVIAGALLVSFAPLTASLSAEDRPSSASIDAAHQPGPIRSGVLPRARASASKVGNALLKLKETAPESDHYAAAERPSAGQQSVSVESMDTLVFHLCLVMLVMLLG